ncbi:hypothetical protein JTE90_015598 [Oedothorax gibbosus]|uniref:C2H2-type domain-containing protein n=1 Tax=Oedothorax gibbosus TaxID=931172 RepID=A0AAV6UV53_9ARAC|nr:hypothetical protein JTE90_015598 [Oedothorax gibbosus]
MKRSHAFHEKIRLNLSKKLRLPQDQIASERGSDEIGKEGSAIPSSSEDPQLQEINSTEEPLTETLSTSTELFRTRLTARLKSTLDSLVSELQKAPQSDVVSSSDVEILQDKTSSDESSAKSNVENDAAELVLLNFIQSAKSQISGLLSKRKQASSENRKRITKPFNVDPLQIQISLKLQDLLCNALDNQRCENNTVSSNTSDLINEIELRNLSHLLQDFLSTAKKKLSFSLNPDSERISQLGKKASASEHSQLSVHKTSLARKSPVKPQVQKFDGSREVQNKRQLRQRVAESFASNSQLVINNKNSNKQNIRTKDQNVVNESSSDHINTNSKKRPLSPNKSCQSYISDNKQSKSINILDKNLVQVNGNNNSFESNELLNIQSQSKSQNKSSQSKELVKTNHIPNPKSNNKEINCNPKSLNLSQEVMETSQYSSVHDNPNYRNSGILLLSECERTPDFLDLNLEVQDSDADDPDPVYSRADFIRSTYQDSDSDEDVVLLGEKKPTYQEITLDEDDDGEVCEKVVEVQKPTRIPKSFQDLLYDCPNCDKKFRVESLLKFHVRMHSVVESTLGRAASPTQPEIIEEIQAEEKAKKLKSSQRHRRKEKENTKQNSKASRKPKLLKEKHAKKKSKTTP